MQAWRVHELGEPSDVMVLDDVEAPTPGEGEVLLDVAAASLNFPDVLMCRGIYQDKPALPFVPGGEVSGTIVGQGEGVDGLEIGQRVLAVTRTGGLCEQTVAHQATVYPIPDTLDFASAAALASQAGDIETDSKTFLAVKCGDGRALSLTEIQLENKKKLTIKDFLAGFRGNFPVSGHPSMPRLSCRAQG